MPVFLCRNGINEINLFLLMISRLFMFLLFQSHTRLHACFLSICLYLSGKRKPVSGYEKIHFTLTGGIHGNRCFVQ